MSWEPKCFADAHNNVAMQQIRKAVKADWDSM